MDYDKDKYTLNMEDILSKLNIEIPKGYIEVKRAKDDSKKRKQQRENRTRQTIKLFLVLMMVELVHILFLKR
mgnify:CR=1 FL=1